MIELLTTKKNMLAVTTGHCTATHVADDQLFQLENQCNVLPRPFRGLLIVTVQNLPFFNYT